RLPGRRVADAPAVGADAQPAVGRPGRRLAGRRRAGRLGRRRHGAVRPGRRSPGRRVHRGPRAAAGHRRGRPGRHLVRGQAAPPPAPHAARGEAGGVRGRPSAEPRARRRLASGGRRHGGRLGRRAPGRPRRAAGLTAGRPSPGRDLGPFPSRAGGRTVDSAGSPRGGTMRAVVYHGPGRKAWEEVPDPTLQDDTDAVVRVDAVTICGTDLHILKGDVPAVTDGRVLGHEAVGTVEQVGPGVRDVQVGDKVLVSCISACGTCRYCREGAYGQCLNGGGWILGHTIDGTQAEYVRVPFADTSTHKAPAGVSDEQLLMLADILPTGFEVGVLNGRVQPGDVVVAVGAGPIGLAAITGARLYSPAHVVAVDLADSRLEAAKAFGADVTVDNGREDPWEVVAGLTDGLGADVAMEAVGVPPTFELAAR